MPLQYSSIQIDKDQHRKLRVLATIWNANMRQIQNILIGLGIAQLNEEEKIMFLKLTQGKEDAK